MKNYFNWIPRSSRGMTVILKIGLVVLLIAAIIVFLALDLQQYLSLEYIKAQQHKFSEYYQANRAQTIAAFGLAYIAITAFSLPGAAIMTILSGALFGFDLGSMIACPASTIGATIAFLMARFLLRDTVNRQFAQKIKIVNDGIEKEGAFYLFTLRLVPIFPFFMINILMGLTPIRTLVFFIVSLLGMMPGTMVFVYAGTQLGAIESVGDIFSPSLISAFVLLGFFPLIAKKTLGFIRKRKDI